MDICAFKRSKMTLAEKLYLLHKGMDGAFFKFGIFIFYAKMKIPDLEPPK